jgi:hypothetical protein
MPPIRPAVAFALAAFLAATDASPQTFPVTPGTLEFQLGFAAIALPEEQDGAFSGEIEGRAGWFVREGIELQAEVAARVYPLGSVAPKSYGGGVSALWFPRIGEMRNLYLLGGLAFEYLDYPPNYGVASSTSPVVVGGGGIKIPLEASGIPFLRGGHLTAEYRLEWIRLSEEAVDPVYGDRLDLQSGVSLGYSIFR